jgi:hypothetical protein
LSPRTPRYSESGRLLGSDLEVDMPVGRRRVFLPAEQTHQLLADRIARISALYDLADREGAHRVANFDARPVGAGVGDPSARRRVAGKIVVLNEKFVFGDGRNVAVPNVKVLGLRNAVRTRLEPNLPVACH